VTDEEEGAGRPGVEAAADGTGAESNAVREKAPKKGPPMGCPGRPAKRAEAGGRDTPPRPEGESPTSRGMDTPPKGSPPKASATTDAPPMGGPQANAWDVPPMGCSLTVAPPTKGEAEQGPPTDPEVGGPPTESETPGAGEERYATMKDVPRTSTGEGANRLSNKSSPDDKMWLGRLSMGMIIAPTPRAQQ
jgi:hypothetical protein